MTRAIFTTQPSNSDPKHNPYWEGGILPKIGQHQNTLIAIYNPALLDNLAFDTSATHAHFYREGFEEVIEERGWVVARHEDTYVGLYSAQPTAWAEEPSAYAGRDLIAQGKNNIWLCHVGDRNTSSSFQAFVDMVLTSVVEINTVERDSLLGCFEDNSCLTGNILDLVQCFSSGTCALAEHLQTSELSRCLINHTEETLDDVLDIVNHTIGTKDHAHTVLPYINCLSIAEQEMKVRWYLNGTLFSFGWNEPFEVEVTSASV